MIIVISLWVTCYTLYRFKSQHYYYFYLNQLRLYLACCLDVLIIAGDNHCKLSHNQTIYVQVLAFCIGCRHHRNLRHSRGNDVYASQSFQSFSCKKSRAEGHLRKWFSRAFTFYLNKIRVWCWTFYLQREFSQFEIKTCSKSKFEKYSFSLMFKNSVIISFHSSCTITKKI